VAGWIRGVAPKFVLTNFLSLCLFLTFPLSLEQEGHHAKKMKEKRVAAGFSQGKLKGNGYKIDLAKSLVRRSLASV